MINESYNENQKDDSSQASNVSVTAKRDGRKQKIDLDVLDAEQTLIQ